MVTLPAEIQLLQDLLETKILAYFSGLIRNIQEKQFFIKNFTQIVKFEHFLSIIFLIKEVLYLRNK